MNSHFADILLWLFIIVLGLATGAGLYERQIVLPRWFVRDANGRRSLNSDAMRVDDSGRRFWAFVTTGPLTLLTLASLPVAWYSAGTLRPWWLAAAAGALLERLATFGYFIPAALRFMRYREASSHPTGNAALWLRLNDARLGLTLISWVLALRAFSLMSG